MNLKHKFLNTIKEFYFYYILITKSKKNMRTSSVSTVSNRPTSYAKRTYIQKTSSINKRLRTGDVTRIAEATGFSTPYVSQVLNGQYFNDRIVNKAFDMTRGRMSNATKLSQLANA